MRDAIRAALKAAIPELKEVYDPYVPKKDTPLPYAVVVIGGDTQRQDPTNVARTVQVWLNYPVGQLEALDKATTAAVNALHYQTLTNPDTGKSYTAAFEGVLGEDSRDEEWNMEYRGISFYFVSLYENVEADPWEIALRDFVYETTGIKSYAGKWTTDFTVPSILARRTRAEVETESFGVIKQSKTLNLHFVFLEGEKAAMETVGFALERAFKIPLNPDERTYLTVERISENTEADALGSGQITVDLYRYHQMKPDEIDINKIILTKEHIYE